MVDSSPQCMSSALPIHSVIESATRKERDRGQGKDGRGDPAAKFGGDGHKGEPCHD